MVPQSLSFSFSHDNSVEVDRGSSCTRSGKSLLDDPAEAHGKFCKLSVMPLFVKFLCRSASRDLGSNTSPIGKVISDSPPQLPHHHGPLWWTTHWGSPDRVRCSSRPTAMAESPPVTSLSLFCPESLGF